MVAITSRARWHARIAGTLCIAFGCGMYAVHARDLANAAAPPPQPIVVQQLPLPEEPKKVQEPAVAAAPDETPPPVPAAPQPPEPEPTTAATVQPAPIVSTPPAPPPEAVSIPRTTVGLGPPRVPATSTFMGRSPSYGYARPGPPTAFYGRYEPRYPVARTSSHGFAPPPPRMSRMPPPHAPGRRR
jgi:hypothetical protein